MNSSFKKVWSIISTVIVALVVLLAIFLVGSRLFGYYVFNVLTGSMSPEYNPGDLIYVKEVPATSVKVGDPITFVLNEQLVVATHRVVEIDYENQCFVTKGDANGQADPAPVHFNNLIGKPHFKIPKLGYVSGFIQNPPGTYIAVGVAGLLIVLVFGLDFLSSAKEKKNKKAQSATEGESENKSESR